MVGETVSVTVVPNEKVDVENGDVIMYSVNSDCASNVKVLLTVNDYKPGELHACENIVVGGLSADDVTIHLGEIVEKTTVSFKLDSESDPFYCGNNVNCTVVDYLGHTATVSVGSKSDIKVSNYNYTRYAFVKTAKNTKDEVTDIVIFNVPRE